MKAALFSTAAGLGLAAVLLCSPEPGAGQAAKKAAGRGGWMGDYASAKAAAKASGKPMFVVFRCQP